MDEIEYYKQILENDENYLSYGLQLYDHIISNDEIQMLVFTKQILTQYYSDWLRKYLTPKYYFIACQKNGDLIKFVPAEYITQELCNVACQSNPRAIYYVPIKFKTYELCLNVCQNAGDCLARVPDVFRDEQMCIAACSNLRYARKFVMESILSLESLAKINDIIKIKEQQEIPIEKIQHDNAKEYIIDQILNNSNSANIEKHLTDELAVLRCIKFPKCFKYLPNKFRSFSNLFKIYNRNKSVIQCVGLYTAKKISDLYYKNILIKFNLPVELRNYIYEF